LTRLLVTQGSSVAGNLFGVGRRCVGVGGASCGVVVEDDVGAAERAVDVGAEPGGDAGGVEGVGAPGEQAEELAVEELAEADGAVGGARHGARSVPRERDGLDRRLVEPHGPDVPRVVLHGLVLLGSAGFDVCRGGGGWIGAVCLDAGEKGLLLLPPEPPAADETVDGQGGEEEEEEDEGGDHERGYQVAAAVGGGRGRRRAVVVVGVVAAGAGLLQQIRWHRAGDEGTQ
jgi:hypothetical protein